MNIFRCTTDRQKTEQRNAPIACKGQWFTQRRQERLLR
jgi:hypothetical protein